MITAEMAGKALAAFDMTFGGRCDDAHLRMWTNKMRAALEAVLSSALRAIHQVRKG